MPNYDAAAVARLDRRYSTPEMVEQRRRFRDVVRARPGETGLDVGCGAGHLACELAGDVAPGGHIFAIDRSPDSVDATKARIARSGLEHVVETRAGKATALDFPGEMFDFVVATQVYCHVPDVEGATREAARVLHKGGRLVVLDSDWDMCIWESADPGLARRMLDARRARYAHPYLPRHMHRLLRAAGLTLSWAEVFPIIETKYHPDAFGTEVLATTVEQALEHGVPAADVAAWERDLRSRTADGEWFFCLNRFIFAAKKQT
jgi:ubiquinone/menaquinone biosynthesis C-methylase UbiE